MPMGAVQTWGMYNVEGTSDDWFKSDFIIVWVGQPGLHAHPRGALHARGALPRREARGDRPDYSASAVHADYWLNPRVGTDAALALAMAQVILEENLHDEEYVREQTDLPILVRDDTGRYLRESDLIAGAETTSCSTSGTRRRTPGGGPRLPGRGWPKSLRSGARAPRSPAAAP